MDRKKSPARRAKRHAKHVEDNYWDCSVCTYRNTAEAFKCLMCDVRKGTSTRKPRINPQLVAQQVASQFPPAAAAAASAAAGVATVAKRPPGGGARGAGAPRRRRPPRLRNVDRSTAQTREVTVNSVTVVITEYKPKARAVTPATAAAGASSSSGASDHGSQSESSMDAPTR